jgi:hypothetical protein
MTTLSRSEASSLRTTYVKLSRDYRLVEQQFKNVQLDVKRKRGLAEAMQRDAVRIEEEEADRRKKREMGGGENNMMAEGMRWQMQIQEDVSGEKREIDGPVLHDEKSSFLPFLSRPAAALRC